MSKPPQIKPLGTTAKWIHMQIICSPGWGKTIFGGTGGEKVLFLTTDPEGTLSAYIQGSKAEEWVIQTWTDLNKAYAWLRKEGHKLYEWVVIDNLPQAQVLAMQVCMNLRIGSEIVDFEALAKMEKLVSNDLNKYQPAIQDYQRSQNMVREMVLKFHDLPMNVLWTDHISYREDTTGNTFYASSVHGQEGALAQEIMGFMNIVGFGEVVQKGDAEARRLHFSNVGPYRGKDRFDVLGQARDDITLPRVHALVKNRLSGKTSATAGTKSTKAPVRRAARKVAS